ncbi:hypothetical protein PG996_013331 [Apiospora saccharicola]|uniref:Uncharacterized protein n=1 Tax=Apiospora saccharicola TaxID=335842 RepID=A0ABR1U556_9PEZI
MPSSTKARQGILRNRRNAIYFESDSFRSRRAMCKPVKEQEYHRHERYRKYEAHPLCVPTDLRDGPIYRQRARPLRRSIYRRRTSSTFLDTPTKAINQSDE